MDKNFVKKYGLNEDVDRFNKIANYKSPRQSLKEYTFYEADDDQGQTPPQGQGMAQGGQQMQQPNQQQMQPQGGDMGMQQPMDGGQGMDMQGGMPMDNGMQGQMPMDGGQGMDMQGEMPMDNGMQQPMDMQGEMPMDDGSGMDMQGDMPDDVDGDIETTEMEGDEVIDVDDLTQSQEETEEKVDGVDERLTNLLKVVKELGKILNHNNEKIDDLQKEFEKRNPTEQEKLNIRSQSIGPFNQTPRDYWDNKKAADPRYNVIYDNETSPATEQEKFELRKSDLDGLDMKSIADTLNIDQKLEDYLNW